MWFKPDSILSATTHDPDFTYLFGKNFGGNNAGDMGITWPRGEGDLQCFVQNGEVTQDVRAGIVLWEPRWYHVAFVWDKDDSMRVFIDGVQSLDIEPDEPEEGSLAVEGGDQLLVIGSGATELLDARFETFRGTIDEVRISAVARYTSDFPLASQPFEPDAFTVALWHFDEGMGDVAEDATGNGFTGVLGDPDSLGHADPEWVDIQRDLRILINEVLVDPAVAVEDGDANGDGVRQAQEDEFVELLNITSNPIDLTGWKVGDDERIDFQFPDGYILQPFEFLCIFGGGDVSNLPGYDADPLLTRVFATGDSIGNGLANGGDYFILQSADGNHDMYWAYGSKFGAGPPISAAVDSITWEFEVETAAIAKNDNSVTRSPDADVSVEDPFVEHLTVSQDPFSPMTTIGGDLSLSFQVTASASPAGTGTVSLDPDTTSYPFGTIVTFQATPEEFYVFSHWTVGGDEIQNNPISEVVTADLSVTAHFVEAFSVIPTIIVNEILADPDGDPVLGDANGDGVRNSSEDEFVELANISPDAIDMTGWTLGDDEQISFTFPDGYMMQPGQITVIFGGGDVSNVPGYSSNPLETRVFISDSLNAGGSGVVGNGLANSGDFFLLYSPDGSYDLYAGYNNKYNIGGPTSDVVAGVDFEIRIETAAIANNNNSVTRSPDGDISVGDPFVEHNTVSSNLQSPGQTIDGLDEVPIVGIENVITGESPQTFQLLQNFPNPFNPSTTIVFALPKSSIVSLKLYNVQGQEIRELVSDALTAGRYEILWDGKNSFGQPVASGIYFYQIQADTFTDIKKMILLK